MVRYSHPGERGRDPVPLTQHNADIVGRLETVVPTDARTITGKPLRAFVVRLAHVHDAGKLTQWFQQYIGELEGEPDGPTHHAPLGALLAFYVLDTAGYSPEECLAGYVVVASHHRELPDVADYVYERTRWVPNRPELTKTQQAVQKQVANIDGTASGEAAELVRSATDGDGSWTEFRRRVEDGSLFESVHDLVSHRRTASGHSLSPSFYPLVLQAWSALVLADKTSAASVPVDALTGAKPDRSTLADYIDSLPEDDSQLSDRERTLNDRRDEARRSAVGRVDAMVEAGADVATLTLPTGLGKTLTGLEAALKLRDQTGRERVVYALPFTSIVDQVSDVATDVFDADIGGDVLTVHHHLAETLIEIDDDERPDTDEHAGVETMLGESWRAGLTVTTFVQLFESLAGPKNAQSMKIPALYDSVVVLDEPQALPHTWWDLVDRLVEILTERFDATVVAMTATQPGLFEDRFELVDTPEQYFGAEAVERTAYALDESFEAFIQGRDEPLSYDVAAAELVDSVRSEGATLAVCNTIDSARELTETVADRTAVTEVGRVLSSELGTGDPEAIVGSVVDRVASSDGVALLHLSTRLRPRDRSIAIDVAKRLTERGHPLLTVSTQLVEAGVDISFAAVYRDVAPMDSIVQAAGRCNRSFERDRGTVTVWWLAPPGDRETTPGVAVYDKWSSGDGENSLLKITARAIDEVRDDGCCRLSDATVSYHGVRAYYQRLSDRDPGRESWVDHVDEAEIERLGEKSLIDQRRAVDVIVARTADGSETIGEIREYWTRGEYDEARKRLEETRDRRVSVPVYTDDSEEADRIAQLPRIHEGSELRVLDLTKGMFEEYFDPTTGLVLPDSTVERRFL